MLKRLAETALLASGLPSLSRATHRGRTLVLAYHNVVPAGASPVGDRSLHLPQARFAEQLDALTATHEVVPLASVLERGAGDRPRVVITFDDAYRGALTAGLAELTLRKLPATVFVAPGILGNQVTWWDAFADATTGEVDPSFRHAALTECRGDASRVRDRAAREVRAANDIPVWARTVDEDELAHAVAAGIRVGSHSWSHANLAALDGKDLEDEIVRPSAWLRERFAPSWEPWLAYPYGLSSASAEATCMRSGYRGAFLVSGGFMTDASPAPARLPRLNVPSGLSRAGFALRAAGVFAG